MGNTSFCDAVFCRSLGRAASPCCVVPHEDEMLERMFPADSTLYVKQFCVYVPIWDGARSMLALQMCSPKFVPTVFMQPGAPLPGVTVDLENVPEDLYPLLRTTEAAYNPQKSEEFY